MTNLSSKTGRHIAVISLEKGKPESMARKDTQVAYILQHIPVPSETFVINEILALQELGITIFPVSLYEAVDCHQDLIARLEHKILNLSHLTDNSVPPPPNLDAAQAITEELCLPSHYATHGAAVADYAKRIGIDLLHAHFATEAALIALVASRLTGIPFSFTAHAYDLFNTDKNATGGLTVEERLGVLVPNACRVFTISEYNLRLISSLIQLQDRDKLQIIRCGIDPDFFPWIPRSHSDKVNFLCVGRLVEKKGHQFLLKAFQQVCRQLDNVRLRLIGDGYLKDQIQNLCNELGLQDRIEFLGSVASSVVFEEMKKADVFVLHSITASSGDMEGIPVSVMEASATGLPVIVTKHSGISELVLDGETGFVTEEKDISALATSMMSLARASELREKLGVAGSRYVRENFNLHVEANKLKDSFLSQVNRGSHGIPPVPPARPRKKNIAYLTNMSCNPLEGGGYVHVHQIARHLMAQGHRLYTNLEKESPRLVSFRRKDFESRGGEIDVFYIRIHGHPGNDELTLYRNFNKKALCIWEINAPLEELATGGIAPSEIEQLNIRRKELATLVDGAICVSREMQEYAVNELGIVNAHLVPNGSDPHLFSPEKRVDDFYGENFKVLWSGSTAFPWQAYRLVEEVARRVANIDPHILFLMTSDAPELPNTVSLGRVPYHEMPKYMASADCGLCIYEPIDFYPRFFFSPLKMYDYMASGIPVIGSNLGQIEETIARFKCGVLTDTTVDDVVDKILYLKNHKAVAKQMGEAGRDAVRRHHNWSGIAATMEKSFDATPLRSVDLTSEVSRSLPPLRASVVICTYNRSGLLRESLVAVSRQNFPIDLFEIIIVDNNSSDDTKTVSEAAAAELPVQVRYVSEKRQGLSFARNAGILHARGAIVVFVDDDIDADSNWLHELVAAFDDSGVGCAGGPIRPVWPGARPAWLTKAWEGYLTISEFDSARATGEFQPPNTPWGANMAFRKSVLEETGLFPTELGRIGKSLLSNEELTLCKRIAGSGLKIKLAPNAVIHHKIAPERLTRSWFHHRTYYQGISDAILDADDSATISSRLRVFATILFRNHVERDKSFDTECFDRLIIGYLYRMVSGSRDANDFRKLRVLRTFLKHLLAHSRQATGDEPRDKVAGELLLPGQDQTTQLRQMLAEKELLLLEKDRLLKEKEERVQDLLNSASWKITAPLRRLYEWLSAFKN